MRKIDDPQDFIWEVKYELQEEYNDLKREIQEIKEGFNVWNQLIEYTIPFSYEKKIKEINSFLITTDLPSILETYREKIKPGDNFPYIIDQKVIDDEKWFDDMVFRNTMFLKNSKTFLDISKNLYWDIKPILLYYSSSYLFSFFINTFIKYDIKNYHHGLILKMKVDKPENVKIKILGYGLFPRIVKSLSFIYYGSIFSDYIIDFNNVSGQQNEEVILYNNKNKYSISEKQKEFTVKDLLNINLKDWFDNIKLEHRVYNMDEKFFSTSSLLKDYLLIFIACNLARYNPTLWSEIYEGKTSKLFLHYQKSMENVENMVFFILKIIEKWEKKEKADFLHTLGL